MASRRDNPSESNTQKIPTFGISRAYVFDENLNTTGLIRAMVVMLLCPTISSVSAPPRCSFFMINALAKKSTWTTSGSTFCRGFLSRPRSPCLVWAAFPCCVEGCKPPQILIGRKVHPLRQRSLVHG